MGRRPTIPAHRAAARTPEAIRARIAAREPPRPGARRTRQREEVEDEADRPARDRPVLLPLAGLALVAALLAFEVVGQPLSRVGPFMALAVVAVIGLRVMRRFRR